MGECQVTQPEQASQARRRVIWVLAVLFAVVAGALITRTLVVYYTTCLLYTSDAADDSALV